MAFLKEYTSLGSLGSGGFAEVFKVRHNQLGYVRAIRVLNQIVESEDSQLLSPCLLKSSVVESIYLISFLTALPSFSEFFRLHSHSKYRLAGFV